MRAPDRMGGLDVEEGLVMDDMPLTQRGLEERLGATYPSLRGKRVVVTGGGSGIGAGLVEAFVRQEARVVFLDIAEADSLALSKRLAGAAAPPQFQRCDLTDLDQLSAAFEAIGAVDVLVNNAGNDDRHSLEDVTPA